MSIASEITRIQEGKADLKSSINAKNDEQHQITTETIDDYYKFVDSIPTGTTPNNCKVWVYNHTSSGSTGETITLETNDNWIAQNYNNSTLVMSITNINTNALAAKTLYGLIQTNTTAYGSYAGRSFRTSLSSTSWSDNGITRKIMDTGDVGFVANSSGRLTFKSADNGSVLYLPSGTYIIVAAISQ